MKTWKTIKKMVVAKNVYEKILIFRHFRMDSPKTHTIHRHRISFNFVFHLLRLSILFNLINRCNDDTYAFHRIPLLDGSISPRCSPLTCRSIVEAATECYDTSTCLAIAHKGNERKQCMSCTCPADRAALDKNGMFYFSDVELFQKRE